MARYLDPEADFTFKRILTDHRGLGVDFLNAVMPFENGRQAVEIEYMPYEVMPEHSCKKYTGQSARIAEPEKFLYNK